MALTPEQRNEPLRLRLGRKLSAEADQHPVITLYDGDVCIGTIATPWAQRIVAEVERLTTWLDEIEQAAGFGPLSEVADHQRTRGLDGDHEGRLRAKRVAKILATVREESEWRHQVKAEIAVEYEAEVERLTAELAEYERDDRERTERHMAERRAAERAGGLGDATPRLREQAFAELREVRAELAQARQRNEAALAWHKKRGGRNPLCGHCMMLWPCITVRALTGQDGGGNG